MIIIIAFLFCLSGMPLIFEPVAYYLCLDLVFVSAKVGSLPFIFVIVYDKFSHGGVCVASYFCRICTLYVFA